MTSEARLKCVPSTMIIGVGCGKSYSISNPTRIFTRKAFPAAECSKWRRNLRMQGAGCLIQPNVVGIEENDS
jgi:hypothetical protein